jgi:energy-coupling factor transport system substrate-specific component
MRPRAWALLGVSSLIGIVAFAWPLLADPAGNASSAHAGDAPWLLAVLLPLLLAVVLAELAEGALDAKSVALLGVLAACGAALRLPSGGVAGFEPVFFLLIPAGRVLGKGFGFVLGALTLFVSALLTGGVGPWLPFQMLGAAWMGFFAGCLPPARGRAEVAMVAAYGAVAALAYGLLLNLSFWPYVAGSDSALSFVPGAGLAENLKHFWAFHLATSLGFDLPRAVFTAGFLLVAGRPVMAALRRTSRRAAFGAPVAFTSADAAVTTAPPVGGPTPSPAVSPVAGSTASPVVEAP